MARFKWMESNLAKVADGAIVGSALKVGRKASRPVDPGAARDFVAAARQVGWR